MQACISFFTSSRPPQLHVSRLGDTPHIPNPAVCSGFSALIRVLKSIFMRRIALLALFAAAGLAQDTAELFNRAPKSVDDALRARIDEFYQFHKNREFRKAEALVAEDTKDFFYDHDKPEVLGFEISRIEYSDGYTRAKATVLVEQRVMFPGFGGKVMKIPTPSYWKIEDGKWCWYVDKEKLNETPFGVMKAGPQASNDSSVAGTMSNLPSTVDELMNQIHADKSALTLSPGETGQVTIDNTLKGPVPLTIQGKVEGIKATLDLPTVPAGGKATLTVKAAEGAKSGTISVVASQIGKTMPIQITIK